MGEVIQSDPVWTQKLKIENLKLQASKLQAKD